MFWRMANGLSKMLLPYTSTLPHVGGMKHVIIFINVDFPAPLGPNNPTISPSLMEKLTWSSAFWLPYILVMFSTVIDI